MQRARAQNTLPLENPCQFPPGGISQEGVSCLFPRLQSTCKGVACLSTFHTIARERAEFLRQVSLPQQCGAVRDVAEFPLEVNSSRIKQMG